MRPRHRDAADRSTCLIRAGHLWPLLVRQSLERRPVPLGGPSRIGPIDYAGSGSPPLRRNSRVNYRKIRLPYGKSLDVKNGHASVLGRPVGVRIRPPRVSDTVAKRCTSPSRQLDVGRSRRQGTSESTCRCRHTPADGQRRCTPRHAIYWPSDKRFESAQRAADERVATEHGAARITHSNRALK